MTPDLELQYYKIRMFLSGTEKLEAEIMTHCTERLPEYMAPKKITFIEDFPLNASGKVDRLKLRKMLEEM